jgi:alpha-L-arabinofuranosidase
MNTMRIKRAVGICVSALMIAPRPAVAQTPAVTTITVHADAPGVKINPDMYGIFFEEINHAGEGGLYAELVKNRTFKEITKDGPAGWSAHGDGSLDVTLTTDQSVPLNEANNFAGKVEIKSNGHADDHKPFGSVSNDGYWGMNIRPGEKYNLSFYARGGEGFKGDLLVAMENAGGTSLGQRQFTGVTGEWKKYTAQITATGGDPKARLVIGSGSPGTFYLNVVSLFPDDTFNHRPNGLRKDLARMVADLHPAFMRFPGGCYVEGDSLDSRFQWKKTIGDIADRPGHANANWRYWSTDGLGYHEYLQFCADIGAAPLYVFNVGMSHRQQIPMNKLQPFIDDALDAIEYANGPVTSKYGAMRAKAGHPEPFGLKYVEIGNENGLFGNNRGQWGGSYDEYQARYKPAYEAIHAKYPGIQCIANTRVGSKMDLVDDHVYEAPGWFWGNQHKYDTEPRNGLHVYVGEYADTKDCGQGNLRAALAEAAYMNGFEHNADLVRMSSYAPMFVQVNDRTWNPDMMVFDSSRSFGTPSYWVQALYASHRPDESLPTDLNFVSPAADPAGKGTIGLGTWNTQSEYKDVTVVADGKTLYASDTGTNGDWKPATGAWTFDHGDIKQTDEGTDHRDVLTIPATADVADYTVTLKARKNGGAEGFLVMFRAVDDGNYYWWNIGGWGNTLTVLEKAEGGAKHEVGRRSAVKVDAGRWYDLKLEVRGNTFRGYVDGRLVTDVPDLRPVRFAAIGGRNDKDGSVVLKVVNGTNDDVAATVKLAGVGAVSPVAEAVTLTSGNDADENSFADPMKVSPETTAVGDASGEFKYVFPRQSLTILTVNKK